jgi:pectinesterase
MRITYLTKLLIGFLLIIVPFLSVFGQGNYGATSYFNFVYSSVADWTGFTGAASFKTVVDGDSLIFGGCDATGPTRVKGGYTGAVRATSIELPAYASLGYLSFYIQNGSSGTARNIYLKVWDSASSSWMTAETIVIGGNVDKRIVASSVLSKKGVKVKIDSDGKYFWFFQLEAWSSKLATADPNEAPKLLSVDPLPGTTVPSTDTVRVQYDELIKMGTGALSFSGATLTPSFVGNTLQVLYAGLTKVNDTLVIPASFVQDVANIHPVRDTSFIYANDVTAPVYISASPADNSFIHINDVVSKIVVNFDENVVYNAGAISFGPASVTPTFSGKTLTIGYSGLAYNTPYTLTIPANFLKDVSGNTYKSDIVLHYTTNRRDSISPTLLSQSILNGAINVPIGGSISLLFSEIVKQPGLISINGMPIVTSLNAGMVGINYTNFEYNSTYTVSIPAGAITDTTGNAYAGQTFTFTTKSFASKAFDIIVAKDGSGNYATMQAAINAVPDNGTDRTFVYVKKGVYNEKVTIPATKINLSLIGQDSSNTIISYNDYAGGAGGTDNSFTIDIQAAGFYAENITIKNTWATTGGSTNQAVALMTEGDKQVFKNCRALSFQDTHYPKQPNTREYYLNCFIQGATDFMFGGATAFFESSQINALNGGQYLTAPSGNSREFGLVYNNCVLTAQANVPVQTYYLGRPWKDFGKTVYLNTKMGPHIKDIGWAVWATAGADADNQWTGFYAEYNSMDLAGAPINPTRAAWGQKLTPTQAARYTIDNVFNYGSGSDSWNPLPFSTAPDAPTNLTVTTNTLTWVAPKFAVGYVIFRNDSVIGTSTSTGFMDNAPISNGVYRIKAVNEYGAQSTFSDLPLSVEEEALYSPNALYPNPFTESISLKNSELAKTVTFYTVDGQMVKQVLAAPHIKTEDLKSGYYTIQITTVSGGRYNVKMLKK